MRDSTIKTARLGLAAATAALCLASAGGTGAATPPIGSRPVSYVAREQPVAAFLQQFFSDIGVPVSISPTVRGTVNGPFSGSASSVYGQITKAFNLSTYFDGVTVYVYNSSEISTRVFPVQTGVAPRVRGTIEQLKLEDAENRVQDSGDLLIATGTNRFLQQVEELARAYGLTQVISPAVEYRVFYLRYAWAEDITITASGREVTVPGVASILKSLLLRDGAIDTARRDRLLPATVPGLRGQGLAAQSAAAPGAVAAASGGTLGLPGAVDPALAAQPTVDPTTAAATANAGGVAVVNAPDVVRVQADSRLNAVIVRDVGERMATYESLVRALDVEPTLLEIEATIIDLNTDRLRELGINFRFDDGLGGVLFGSGNAESDLRLFPGRDSRDITPSNRGLAISTVIGDSDTFTSRIQALETKGAARIVSRPQIITLSNVEAVFDSNQTFYVRLEGERDVDLFNVTAGTSLRVTPHVSRDGNETRIRMLINIQDGALTDSQVDAIPVVQRSAINTQALIVEGQSLLVGGLTVETDSDRTDQVPVLGEIPVLGNLFKTRRRSNQRIERLFLITPRLAPTATGAPSLPPVPRLNIPLPPAPLPAPAPLSPTMPNPPPLPTMAPAIRPGAPATAPVTATPVQPAPAAAAGAVAMPMIPPPPPPGVVVTPQTGAAPSAAPPPATVAPRPPVTMQPIPDPEPTRTQARSRARSGRRG